MKVFFIIVVFFSTLYSAPAFGGKRIFHQKDGSSFEARVKGDEYLNWIESDSGDILVHNPKTDNFDYAQIKDNQLKASGYLFNPKHRTRSLIQTPTHSELEKLWHLRRQKEMFRRSHHSKRDSE